MQICNSKLPNSPWTMLCSIGEQRHCALASEHGWCQQFYTLLASCLGFSSFPHTKEGSRRTTDRTPLPAAAGATRELFVRTLPGDSGSKGNSSSWDRPRVAHCTEALAEDEWFVGSGESIGHGLYSCKVQAAGILLWRPVMHKAVWMTASAATHTTGEHLSGKDLCSWNFCIPASTHAGPGPCEIIKMLQVSLRQESPCK